MKRLMIAAAALAALSAPLTASAQFAGALAPATWTTSVTGPSFGSLVTTTGAPGSVSIRGGNDATGGGCPDGTAPGFVGGCQIAWSHTGPLDFSFSWSYATADISPQYDSFGMVVDGVRFGLIANGGNLTQSGNALVHAVASFAWYINCSDCTGGAATATIGNISTVPEPASVALLALGLVAVAVRASAQRKTRG